MDSKIMAVITTQKEQIAGGAPIFIMPNHEKMQRVAITLEKILDGMVHQVTPDILIIVRHH
ncbi:capping complex subunit for YIEGIA [Brevibacillus sp. B_LB10_24]|uniref:capping complex subunit for YIEGIA n=1 Tax=Brevibacillus sp. B_LB10_24 TaxID=3380645 RepID=UPI0038B73D0C